MQVTKFK